MSRVRRITYQASILGGDYEMTADHAPAPGARWRIIAVPGTPSQPHMFSRFLRLAPQDLDVMAINRAGYGGPFYGPGRRAPVPSFEDQISALAPMIEADERPVIILGVSYGGALSLKAAIDFPDQIRGAMTVAALVTEPRAWVRAILPAGDWPLIRTVLPGYLGNARAEIAGRRSQIADVFGQLKNFDRPVTIMHGNVDWLVAQKDASVLRGYFADDADVYHCHINGGTHYLELLNARTVYAQLRGLIARAELNDRRRKH